MTVARKINQDGLDIIKGCESLRLVPYLCPAGVWTVGWGHTRDVSKGMKITEGQAVSFLEQDCTIAAQPIERLVRVPLTDNQFSALVSFIFNLGSRRFERSTLLWKLNRGSYGAVPAELAKWVWGGGKVLPGLVTRRAMEAKLWMRG